MGVHKFTTEQFVSSARKKHGNKYDYSKVNYTGSFNKVEIICPIHGSFFQTPANHVHGSECPKCGKIKGAKNAALTMRYSYDEFVTKSKQVHGDKYDYSKVNIVNTHTKVEIVCPTHGSFFQSPHAHMRGKGCKQCSIDVTKYTAEEFLRRAKRKHGDKYDYSNMGYTQYDDPIVIRCPKHGTFSQKPRHHLIGFGCPDCGRDEMTKSGEDFIRDVKKVHGDKYDYSETVYENCKKNVTIRCPKHGYFEQRPSSHLNGNGCPKCKSSVGENIVRVFLENRNVFYIPQKTFPGCKYKNLLRYDFYVRCLNLLIEVDGLQHFPECVGAHRMGCSGRVITQEDYELTKKKDEIKTQYAFNNGIELLRIPYRNRSDKRNILPILKKIIPTTATPIDNPFFG